MSNVRGCGARGAAGGCRAGASPCFCRPGSSSMQTSSLMLFVSNLLELGCSRGCLDKRRNDFLVGTTEQRLLCVAVSERCSVSAQLLGLLSAFPENFCAFFLPLQCFCIMEQTYCVFSMSELQWLVLLKDKPLTNMGCAVSSTSAIPEINHLLLL